MLVTRPDFPSPPTQPLEHPAQKPIHPALWLPYHLYRLGVVIPFLILSTAVLGTLISVLSFMGFANFASRVLATLWAKLNAAVTLMDVTIEGEENLAAGQSYVLAANHLSLVDIYVLYGITGLDVKWVMKKELRAVPVLGLACELMGHIYVDRTNTESALHSIANAKDRIKDGMCVAFFPEGTRSRTTELRSFKKGAFRMAQDLGIPVVPVSIHNTNRVLPSDTLNWRPGKVKLIFHAPVSVNETTNIGELAAQTRQTIVDALNQPND